MATHTQSPSKTGRIKAVARTGTRFSHGAAWFFIATSIASLLWVLGSQIADPAGTTALYSTTFGDETWNALGLTYPGPVGLLWALAQLIVVGWATWQSVRGGIFKKTLGHGVLIGWAAFWAVNLLWLASMNPGVETFTQAAALIGLSACTFVRAVTPYPKRMEASAARSKPAAKSETDQPTWKQKLRDTFNGDDGTVSAKVVVVNPKQAARHARVALASARRRMSPACGAAAKQAREAARRASRFVKQQVASKAA